MREEKLNRFQKALMELSERVGGEVNYVVASIHEDVDAKPDVSSAPVHLADVASDALDADLQVLHTERDILEQIRSALRRIDEGTFGSCMQCGKELSEQRLTALPYAALCVQCAKLPGDAEVRNPPALRR